MAEYPARYVREHRLRDGRAVTLRPIRPDDAALVREFLTGLSGESRYLRFQKWVHAPSEKLVRFLTDVDHDRHLALVCTTRTENGEKIVGEARYVVEPDERTCELGIAIADDWHRTGIAGLLMQALMTAARARGLASMEGLVLAGNREMLRFVRALGFDARSTPEDPRTVRIVKKL